MNKSAVVSSTRIAAWLGYGGLIPFVAFAVLNAVDPERRVFWHEGLRAYGAVILSFVGALHWGLAMAPGNLPVSQRNAMFIWSVVPSLMAFVSLLVHSVLGDLMLIAGFVLHYWRDVRLAASAALPAWYLPLRMRLSAVAMTCIAAGGLMNYR